jgi:hypothetical protein
MPQRQVFGPYRVKNIGVDGDVYEVVEMVDNTSNTYQELRPRKTYLNRQPAYGKCLRLNRRWQKDNILEDAILEYWQDATN